jgi:hypothetical protein
MILVVYVAAALVALREGRSALGRGNPREVVALLLSVPIAFVLLSALVLRPGPHRDWIAACFVFLSLLPLLLVMCAMPLLILVSGGLALGLIAAPILILSPIYALGIMAILREHLCPERCPRCRRRCLIRSFQPLLTNRTRYAYGQCGACDAVHFVKVPAPACPKCGRHTLMHRPYKFAWCASCKGRYKRLWLRPWEDVSSTEDDRFYWLWDPVGKLGVIWSHARKIPS